MASLTPAQLAAATAVDDAVVVRRDGSRHELCAVRALQGFALVAKSIGRPALRSSGRNHLRRPPHRDRVPRRRRPSRSTLDMTPPIASRYKTGPRVGLRRFSRLLLCWSLRGAPSSAVGKLSTPWQPSVLARATPGFHHTE